MYSLCHDDLTLEKAFKAFDELTVLALFQFRNNKSITGSVLKVGLCAFMVVSLSFTVKSRSYRGVTVRMWTRLRFPLSDVCFYIKTIDVTAKGHCALSVNPTEIYLTCHQSCMHARLRVCAPVMFMQRPGEHMDCM